MIGAKITKPTTGRVAVTANRRRQCCLLKADGREDTSIIRAFGRLGGELATTEGSLS